MRLVTKAALAVSALAIAAGAGYGVGQTQVNQPHMQAALGDLQAAQGQLQIAEENKGGHRAAALTLVNQAITQVQAGIAVGGGM
jgi:hypothetical protein